MLGLHSIHWKDTKILECTSSYCFDMLCFELPLWVRGLPMRSLFKWLIIKLVFVHCILGRHSPVLATHSCSTLFRIDAHTFYFDLVTLSSEKTFVVDWVDWSAAILSQSCCMYMYAHNVGGAVLLLHTYCRSSSALRNISLSCLVSKYYLVSNAGVCCIVFVYQRLCFAMLIWWCWYPSSNEGVRLII